jgi:nucleoside-diphosphate-sugar epimerase
VRILVIGGTRLIGPVVVRQLYDLGHQVAVFHCSHTQAYLPSGVDISPVTGEMNYEAEDDLWRRFGSVKKSTYTTGRFRITEVPIPTPAL